MTSPNDDQIRAMLEARADRPDGAVPQDILERVVQAARPSRIAFGLPRLAGAIAAAALVAAVGAVFLVNQPGGPGATGTAGAGAIGGSAVPSAAPSATPSMAPSTAASVAPSELPSAEPSATPSAVPTLAANQPCLSDHLTALILNWQGAAGNRIAEVRVTNKGDQACILAGHPGVQLRGSNGAILIESSGKGTTSEPAGPVRLAPGGQAAIEVDASNYCGKAPALPVTVAFVLPADAGTIVAKAAPGTDDSFAVPPCMGSAPAVISNNGWTAAH
jgi:hypothetical protein